MKMYTPQPITAIHVRKSDIGRDTFSCKNRTRLGFLTVPRIESHNSKKMTRLPVEAADPVHSSSAAYFCLTWHDTNGKLNDVSQFVNLVAILKAVKLNWVHQQ